MKKQYFILIFLVSFSLSGFAINDKSKLSETIGDYANNYITKQPEVAQEFVLTFEEFKKLADDLTDTVEIRKNYIHYTSKIKRLYTSALNAGNEISKFLSYDTLSVYQDGYTMINVCLVFETTGVNGKDNNTKRILSNFIIWGNTLKLTPFIRSLTKSEFYRKEFNEIHDKRYLLLKERYSKVLFNDTIPFVVPMKNAGLWGLQDAKGKVIVKTLYDSIYPFKNGYSLIVKGKTYNLLDQTNFTFIYKEWKSKIRYSEDSEFGDYNPGEGIYYVTNADKSIIKVGTEKVEEYMTVDDDAPAPAPKPKAVTPARQNNFYAQQYIVIDRIYRENETEFNMLNTRLGKVVATYKNFDYIETFGNYFIGQRNDTTFVIDTLGAFIFKTIYSVKSEYPGYLLLLDRNTRLFGVYCPYSKTYISPQFYNIQPVNRDSFFIVLTTKLQLGYLNRKGEKLFE